MMIGDQLRALREQQALRAQRCGPAQSKVLDTSRVFGTYPGRDQFAPCVEAAFENEVWIPFLVVGVAAVFLGLTTKQAGGYRYGKSGAQPTPAAS